MDHLRRILPAEAPEERLYCVAKLSDEGILKNYFRPTLTEVQALITSAVACSETVYVAQAAYDRLVIEAAIEHNKSLIKGDDKSRKKKRRAQENARLIRSFFFDIDCGPGKPYADKKAAAEALRDFLLATKLPKPILESSGNGLYARWVVTEDLEPARWKVVARKLKALAEFHKFEIDPVRTADEASILRPVGAVNFKNRSTPLPVRIITDAPDVDFAQFCAVVANASAKAKLPTIGLTAPGAYTGLNDSFSTGIGEDLPPSDPQQVAHRCQAVRRFKERQGNVPEPVWYNMIGLLRFTEGGEELLQEWSSGHPDYSIAATAEKIEHHKDSGVGPTTCQKIGVEDAAGCVACPHSGHIKSPITLGYPDSVPLDLPKEEAEIIPNGYKRSDRGVEIILDGRSQPIYPYDLFPVSVAFDHTLGYEVVVLRHQLPFKGYHEFSVRSALIHKPTDFLMVLNDNHVHIPQGDPRKLIMGYLDAYFTELRAKKRMNELHPQMGWSKSDEGLVFVLGGEIFRPNEAPVQAGLARSAPEVAKAFTAIGTVEAWSESTRHLAQPGMESLAFGFLSAAFGAPLMYFTGHSGAMVSLVGKTGLGKTMTGKWALSAYGDPDALTLQKDDTPASMISRLGIYGSLPAYIDEISNMGSEPLSELVYRVTQGRERNRLTQKGEEKTGRTTWRTLAICSTNHPLTDRLAALKSDASAEINRLLEIHVTTPADFTAAHCREIFGVFGRNHGGAGRIYVQYLVDHQEEHREKLDKLILEIERRAHALPEERFWVAIAAVTVYGSLIAKRLGLVELDVTRVLAWVIKVIHEQRSTRNDLVTTDVDCIGQFLDRHASGGLITSRDATGSLVSILREPRGQLVYRIMHDQSRLYVSRSALRAFLSETYGSYTGLKKELQAMGALVDHEKRKVLGAGTYFAGSATPCWEIDLTVPALGRQVVRLVGAPAELKVAK